MVDYATIEYISVGRAAELLNKTEHATRQLIHRKKLKKYIVDRKTALKLDDVMTYYARKKRLPSWEENIEIVSQKPFISIEDAAARLTVQPIYLSNLIRAKVLEGYVTCAGNIMVSHDSIQDYLRTPDNEQPESNDAENL